MTQILNTVLSFIKTIFSKEYIGLTLGVIIILLVIFNINSCNKLSIEKKQHVIDNKLNENNIKAMTDTLTNRFDKKLNIVIGEKTSYIVKSVDDLKLLNAGLYTDIKNMKNSVAGIQSSVSTIIPELTSKINEVIPDKNDSSRFTIPWNFNYNDPGITQTLIGNTKFKILNNKPSFPISILDTNKFNIKLNYGFREENGKYIVQATSPSKLVQFTELNGALILDKFPQSTITKSNPWSFGPYVGFGLNTDLNGKGSRFGWSLGVGASYNLFNSIKGGNIFKK